jgi:hypothetical protein
MSNCDSLIHVRLGPQQETQEEVNTRMDEAVQRIMTAIQEKRELMTVRCKVVCNNKTQYGISENIQFSPVYSGSEENKKFFSATPGGNFSFYTVNKEAADQFEMGKEYYFDISPAN